MSVLTRAVSDPLTGSATSRYRVNTTVNLTRGQDSLERCNGADGVPWTCVDWRSFLYFFCTRRSYIAQLFDFVALPTGFEPVLQP
jgi:hypothetical protein